jgi:DNA-binding CsgD family transcriptional regulator
MKSKGNDTSVFSDKLLQKIFDSMSAHISIIDEDGFILETNAAWKKYSRDNGLPHDVDFKQMNYLNVCDASNGEGAKDARIVASGIRSVLEGKVTQFLYDYPCHSPEGCRWFYMRAVLMADKGPSRVIISHEDITDLKLAQEALTQSRDMLEDRNQSLEEANIALKVLIRQRETDKADMEKKFLANVKTFVLPYINKLKQGQLSEKNRTLINIVDDHLKDILSPLMQKLSHADIMLTPQEMQVASFVRDGKTTAEIADILFVSEATVNFHRKNLRTKLGIKNRQANLRSFLLSMS